MGFSKDRDLLAFEPRVFVDVPIAAQQHVHVTDGAISGTTLTSAAADFVAAQVDVGAVVLVNDVAVEVIARVDANTLTVSRPRARETDAAVGPGDGSGLDVKHRTFRPQAATARDMLLSLIGVETDEAATPGSVDAADVLSIDTMRRLEVLGTLSGIYVSAVAIGGCNDTLDAKSRFYRRQFRAALRAAEIAVDTDGDGVANRHVRPGVGRLRRV